MTDSRSSKEVLAVQSLKPAISRVLHNRSILRIASLELLLRTCAIPSHTELRYSIYCTYGVLLLK